MEASVLSRLEKLIAKRAGLQIRKQELPLLQKTLDVRLQALKVADAEAYLRLLTSAGAAAESEWKLLFVQLTNQESYFFRDRGQLSVIRSHILPELIRANHARRSLRVWSAGCSTGEEAYSLAIMIEESLPLREGWDVQVFGTDLSEAALDRARRGVYGAWSFRTVDADVQSRYFRAKASKWEIEPRLRDMVTFRLSNLLDDDFPSQANGLHDIDLIVCRNVFIYFQREAVVRVLRKFGATLRERGHLITGHSELHSIDVSGFVQRAFPQTVVYQRITSPAPTPTPKQQGVRRQAASLALPVVSTNGAPPYAPPKSTLIGSANKAIRVTDTLLIPAPAGASPGKALSAPKPPATVFDEEATISQAVHAMRDGLYVNAMAKLGTVLERNANHLSALCLSAQAQANSGCLDAAEELCRRAIKVNGLASLPYHLLARIAEERGESDAAKTHLKTTIYLNSNSVWSYLELAAIYTREGDNARAAQMRRGALEVLSNRPSDALVPSDEYAVEEPVSVSQLRDQLKAAT